MRVRAINACVRKIVTSQTYARVPAYGSFLLPVRRMTHAKNKQEKMDRITPLPSVQSPVMPGAVQMSPNMSLAPRSSSFVSSGGSSFFSSLAGGASGLLGSLAGGAFNLIGQAINNKHQKKMYAQQRKDALADYEMQREDYLADLADERAYNSPAAQVARMKEAGINPNVAFGSGSAANTSSPAQNTADVKAASPGSPVPSSLGSDMLAGLQRNSQLEIEAEATKGTLELQKAQMLKLLSETKGVDQKTKAQMIENGYLDMMFQSTLRERQASTMKIFDDMETSALNRELMSFDLAKLKPAQVAQIEQSTKKLFQETRSIAQQYYYFAEVKDTRARRETQEYLKSRYETAIARYEKEMKSLDVPSEGKHGFERWYRKTMHDVGLATSVVGDVVSIGFGSALPMPSPTPKRIGYK